MKSTEQQKYEQIVQEHAKALRQALKDATEANPYEDWHWDIWIEELASHLFESSVDEWVNERVAAIANALKAIENLGLPEDFLVAILANNPDVKRAKISKTSITTLLKALGSTLERLKR